MISDRTSVGVGGLYTDSAAVYCSNWVNGAWPSTWANQTIALLELYPVLLALEIWGSHLANRSILLLSDNEAVVHIVNKQSNREPKIMVLVRRLVLCALRLNVLFKANISIPGRQNIISIPGGRSKAGSSIACRGPSRGPTTPSSLQHIMRQLMLASVAPNTRTAYQFINQVQRVCTCDK